MEEREVKKKARQNGSRKQEFRGSGPRVTDHGSPESSAGSVQDETGAASPTKNDRDGFLEELETAWTGLRLSDEEQPRQPRSPATAPPVASAASGADVEASGKAVAIAEALEAAAEVLRRHGQHELARWATDGAFELDRLGRRVDLDALLDELGAIGGRNPRLILAGLMAGAFAVGRNGVEETPPELHRHLM